MHGDLAGALVAVVGADRVRSAATELGLYGRDASTASGSAGLVVLPTTAAEVQGCVRAANRFGAAVVPRGSGTGLAGGAVPLDDAVVICTSKMDRLLEVDLDDGIAWVEPGLLNLDLSRLVAPLGVHYAPDPSSQQASSIGGNVATNAGGPHCLLHGTTTAHVAAVEVVLPDGELVVLGGLDAEPPGLDLRGAFVGSEGMFGIATRIAVRLQPNPPALATLLLDYATVDDGAATVSSVIAAGIVPAAMEMMDAPITRAVEEFVHAGFPLDAAAVLLVEVEGLPAEVAEAADRIEAIGRAHGARSVRRAADPAERAALWKGRKSAFGAVARIKPNYYLHDTVVPRARLVDVLRQVYEIADRHDLLVMNVFHAGDGNLHPLLVYDKREPGADERVHAAGDEIVRASVAAGGVLSGEHGIGLEKRDLMPLLFGPDDLEAQRRVRCAFDPAGRQNPGKVLPRGYSCGDVQALAGLPEGTWI